MNNDDWIIKATYNRTESKNFAGNPFYESLKTDDVLRDEFILMRDMPFIDDEVRDSLDIDERLDLLDDIKDGFILLPNYLRTFEKIIRLIKRGYRNRNPLSKEYIVELNRLGQEMKTQIFSEEPLTKSQYGNEYAEGGSKIMLISGPAGTGKSTVVRVITKSFPRAILHENYDGKRFNALQIPCIKIKCPSDSSLQTICCDFFTEIDIIAGTNHRARFGGTTKDVSAMVNRMRALGAMYGIGLFVIDELQDLVDSKQDTNMVKTFISQLANKVGFPVLLIGTVNAMELFTTASSLRRVVSGGEERYDLMKEGGLEWDFLTEQFWELRVLREDHSDKMPPNIKKALFLASQGNIDYFTKIYLDAQRIALENGEEHMTVEQIACALTNNPSINKMVTAIANKDMDTITDLGDLIMDDRTNDLSKYRKNEEYRKKLEHLTDTLIKNNELRSKDFLHSVVNNIRLAEIAKNLTEEELEVIVSTVIKRYKTEPTEVIILKAFEMAEKEADSKKPKRIKIPKQEGKTNKDYDYEKLKENGFVMEEL